MVQAPTPRLLAAEVVRRVLAEGAFAAAALSAELDRFPQLTPQGRAATTDLTYGALRAGRYLDGRFVQLTSAAFSRVDELTRAQLWVAGYELAFRPSSASHAVVSQAVEGIKTARGRAMGNFTNAALRKLQAELAERPAPPLVEAFVAGSPRWLRRALDRSLGEGQAELFLAAGPVPPPIGLRVRSGERQGWLDRLRGALPDATFEPGQASPRAIVAHGGGDPRRWPGVSEGAVVVQEEGSQVVAAALGARPGERVLDACAGRGNKTRALMDAVEGPVDAADLHGSKLDRLHAEAPGVGARFEVDWSVGPGDVPLGVYDRVLVDAPCSGTGTLRRRPEILLRRAEADLASLQALQRAIVRNAALAVRPGGTLLFAVCSVLAEECEQVIAGLDGFSPGEPRRLLPHRDGTDGYAWVTLVKAG